MTFVIMTNVIWKTYLWQKYYDFCYCVSRSHRFNGSVLISENFRFDLEQLNIICSSILFHKFLSAYKFWIKKYKEIEESNCILPLVSSGWDSSIIEITFKISFRDRLALEKSL